MDRTRARRKGRSRYFDRGFRRPLAEFPPTWSDFSRRIFCHDPGNLFVSPFHRHVRPNTDRDLSLAHSRRRAICPRAFAGVTRGLQSSSTHRTSTRAMSGILCSVRFSPHALSIGNNRKVSSSFSPDSRLSRWKFSCPMKRLNAALPEVAKKSRPVRRPVVVYSRDSDNSF